MHILQFDTSRMILIPLSMFDPCVPARRKSAGVLHSPVVTFHDASLVVKDVVVEMMLSNDVVVMPALLCCRQR